VAYILGTVLYEDLKEPKVGESGYCDGDIGAACSQSRSVQTDQMRSLVHVDKEECPGNHRLGFQISTICRQVAGRYSHTKLAPEAD